MRFIPVYYFTNYIDAHITAGQLENCGLRCWLKDEHTVTIDPILTNAVGGIKLMVAEEDVEEAREILKKTDEERRNHLTCSKCGGHNIEYVSTPRKLSNWVSAIVTFFLGSFALTTDKVFHCFDCGYESKEEPVS